MARSCNVCTHESRSEIDSALVSGEPFRAISRRMGLSKDGLRRHRESHLPLSLIRAAAQEGQDRDRSLLEEVEALKALLQRTLDEVQATGNVHQLLATVREMRAVLELHGKASGELDDRPTVAVNLALDPEWLRVRAAIVSALRPHPEALGSVQTALRELNAG